jgi:hypothetical protein
MKGLLSSIEVVCCSNLMVVKVVRVKRGRSYRRRGSISHSLLGSKAESLLLGKEMVRVDG